MFGKVTVDGTCPVCGCDLGLGHPVRGEHIAFCTNCNSRLNCRGYPRRGAWCVSKSGWLDFFFSSQLAGERRAVKEKIFGCIGCIVFVIIAIVIIGAWLGGR